MDWVIDVILSQRIPISEGDPCNTLDNLLMNNKGPEF